MSFDGAPRDRLALALDRDDAVEAVRLACSLREWFSIAKVGLELFAAAGPSTLTGLVDEGFRVFADLKLHDIPTTVYRAARVLGSYGVSLVTLHATGGEAMLRAGVEGLLEGAERGGAPTPIGLAVLSLTSEEPPDEAVLVERIETAQRAGCQGVVIGGELVATVAKRLPEVLRVVPGIRLPGEEQHDQRQVLTPAEAIGLGADVLVVGRAVTEATDPRAAAAALVATLTDR
jgi:orotidine-5'-phosphate decarboxylase